MTRQRLARGREFDAALATEEECRTDRVLQLSDPLAHGRGCYVAGVGSAGDRPRLRRGDEKPQRQQVKPVRRAHAVAAAASGATLSTRWRGSERTCPPMQAPGMVTAR